MALSVLVYHYSVWSDIKYIYPLEELVSRLGIYAVAAFYILSGATLGLVYLKKDMNQEFLKTFAIKRIFRIAPLLYLATTLTVLISIAAAIKTGISSGIPSLWEMVMNYSLLFGWLDHDSYIATGAWSIGNELFFYSLFPIMLMLIKKSTLYYIIFFVLTVIATLFFSFFLLNGQTNLSNQWAVYINPINQIYLFAGGFLIGWLYKVKEVTVSQKLMVFLLIISIIIFVFLPVTGEDQINYLTGYAKVILSLSIFTMCFSVIFIKTCKKNAATKTLSFFGDISYSIYLLHPIAFSICSIALGLMGFENKYITIIISATASIILATISYRYIETPIIKIGNRLTNKNKRCVQSYRTENTFNQP